MGKQKVKTQRVFIDTALDTLDQFFMAQQRRVAQKLHQSEERWGPLRNDEMERYHVARETDLLRRQ